MGYIEFVSRALSAYIFHDCITHTQLKLWTCEPPEVCYDHLGSQASISWPVKDRWATGRLVLTYDRDSSKGQLTTSLTIMAGLPIQAKLRDLHKFSYTPPRLWSVGMRARPQPTGPGGPSSARRLDSLLTWGKLIGRVQHWWHMGHIFDTIIRFSDHTSWLSTVK